MKTIPELNAYYKGIGHQYRRIKGSFEGDAVNMDKKNPGKGYYLKESLKGSFNLVCCITEMSLPPRN